MYTLFESPAEASKLLMHSHEAVTKFLALVPALQKNILIPMSPSVFADPIHAGKMYCLTEGILSLCFGEDAVIAFEPGDLVGVEQLSELIGSRVSAEFAVRADQYAWDDIKRVAGTPEGATLWSEYLTSRLNAETLIISAFGSGEKNFAPEIKSYSPGDEIIQQGTPATKVYTLLQGHAKVYVNKVQVGDVREDEMFGVLAALTDMTRTASVVATQNSLVLSLDKDKFVDLMKKRPATVVKMVEDMARTIVSLNTKVVNLSGGNAASISTIMAKA